MQSEYFFSRPSDEGTAPFYERRQLAKRFIPSDVLQIGAPTNPATDFFYLHLSFDPIPTDVGVLRNYEGVLIAEETLEKIEFPVIIGEAPDNERVVMRIHGVLTEEDVDNILWDSVEVVTDLRGVMFPDLQFTPELRREFLNEWYSIREIEAPINVNELAFSLQEKLEFPDLPDLEDLPYSLHTSLLINGGQFSWIGFLNPQQDFDLSQLFDPLQSELGAAGRKVFENLDEGLKEEIIFEAAYPLQNPFPDQPVPGALNITINKIGEGVNIVTIWELAWEGYITDDEIFQLSALTDDPEFQTGVTNLLSQFEMGTTEFELIGDGTPTTIPANAPEGFELESVDEDADGTIDRRILRWTKGRVSNEQKTALLALIGDNAFQGGILGLIEKIETETFANATTVNEFPMSWPVFNPTQLGLAIGVDLGGLIISPENQEVSWERNHLSALSREQIMTRLQIYLQPVDPLIDAIDNLLSQVEAREVTTTIEFPILLRIRENLLESEREALRAVTSEPDKEIIDLLFKDLFDRQVLLERAQAAFNCQERIGSIPVNFEVLSFVEFIVAPDAQLVLDGLNTAGLEALNGDDTFDEGIQNLLDKVADTQIEVPILVKKSETPTILLDFQGLTLEEGGEIGFYSSLKWQGEMSEAVNEELKQLNLPIALRIAYWLANYLI